MRYMVILLIGLVLAGCGTIRGIGKDVQDTGTNIQSIASR